MIHGNNINLKLKQGSIKKTVLENINFEIPKGRITCFIGKNGSGKTSLLRCIMNLQKKYTGQITLEGIDIKKVLNCCQAKKIGFVFQDFNLFNNLTVLQNCTLPAIHLLKLSEAQAEQKITKLLNQLNIEDCRNLYPSKLSRGQKQKAAIARTLGLSPSLLILDEPTASLDPESSEKLAETLLHLKKDNMTIALTSHDVPFMNLVLDRSYFLEDGKIVNFIDNQL